MVIYLIESQTPSSWQNFIQLKWAEYFLAFPYLKTVSNSKSPCSHSLLNEFDVTKALVYDRISPKARLVGPCAVHFSCVALDSDRIPIPDLEFVFVHVRVVVWCVVYGESYWRGAVHSFFSISSARVEKLMMYSPSAACICERSCTWDVRPVRVAVAKSPNPGCPCLVVRLTSTWNFRLQQAAQNGWAYAR